MSTPRRLLDPPSGSSAATPTSEGQGARFMISPDPALPGRARVIGTLTGDSVRVVLDAVDGGLTDLDLSEVDRVDASAVHALAGLAAERCTLSACPRWLELWLARVRCDAGA